MGQPRPSRQRAADARYRACRGPGRPGQVVQIRRATRQLGASLADRARAVAARGSGRHPHPRVLVLGIINIPVAALNPSKTELYGDLAGIAGCLVALALNRNGSVALASILLAVLLDAGFAGIILAAPGGLSVPNLLLAPLMALAELIAVSLLAPWTVFLVALINSVFILVVILDGHGRHRPKLAESARRYSLIISPPITLYLIVALVTYLWVRARPLRSSLATAPKSLPR